MRWDAGFELRLFALKTRCHGANSKLYCLKLAQASCGH
jgi:hypothetical protein